MSERTEKMKQKQWVQIAAVFFGLMIVLTICSRAASSAVKARVTVTRASRQKISHEISLNGSVEAKNYILQYVTSGLMVTGVQVSPGQQVEAGDVIFTVDMQKLQESIASIETELNRADEKEHLSVSRAEAAYQDVKANAEEEKALAYQTYEKAVVEYQNYINTHKKTAGVSAESTEERTMNEKAASVYDETVAKELENAVESEKSAYEAVVREQEKQISAAADAVQRTKEDLNLSRDTDTLEEQLKNRACAENGGVYRAEYTGVVGQLNVTAGTETVEGIAIMLADAAETVRFVAELSEEYVDEISGDSVITLHGKNMSGIRENYELSSATVSENAGSETDASGGFRLTADIPGDLYPVGTKVTVTVDNRSDTFDCCLPLSSLHQKGSSQYFIYVMEKEDAVMGTELTAKEVPVTVLDMNEQYVAVDEMISGDVIVSSDKDITDGSRVRLEEE